MLRTSVENQIQGTVSEYFAYASDFDEDKKRYLGLTLAGFRGQVMFDGSGVLVKMEIAEAQQAKDQQQKAQDTQTNSGEVEGVPSDTSTPGDVASPGETTQAPPSMPKRYYGSIELPAASAYEIYRPYAEVVQHFSSDPDNQVSIRVEIEVKSPTGFREKQGLFENSNTLGFNSGEFEQE